MKRISAFSITMFILIGCTNTITTFAQKLQPSTIDVNVTIGTATNKSIVLLGGLDVYEVNNWAIGGSILLYNYPSPNQPADYRPSYNLLSKGKSSFTDEMFTFSFNITKQIPICKYLIANIGLGISENQFSTNYFTPNPDSRGGLFYSPSNYINESKRTYRLGYLAQTKLMVPFNKYTTLGVAFLSNQNPKNSFNAYSLSFDRSINIKGVFSKKKIKAS